MAEWPGSPGGSATGAVEALLRDRFPLFKDVVVRSRATFGAPWQDDFERTLCALFPSPDDLRLAVEGYVGFAMDMMRRQQRFEVERRYPERSYADAAREVYFDDDYMTRQYLPGLLLSHYFWPHHYHQLRFFESAYVSQVRLTDRPQFLEVGIGTGMYSRRLLELVPDASGTGLDVSPASRQFARAHVAAFGFAERYDAALHDVLAEPVTPHEWLLCVEVLEHLEDPPAFLEALRAALSPGGRAFITAALMAPHVDHIYLYERPDEVLAQLTAAGFELEQSFTATAHRPRRPGLPVPEVVAFVVT